MQTRRVCCRQTNLQSAAIKLVFFPPFPYLVARRTECAFIDGAGCITAPLKTSCAPSVHFTPLFSPELEMHLQKPLQTDITLLCSMAEGADNECITSQHLPAVVVYPTPPNSSYPSIHPSPLFSDRQNMSSLHRVWGTRGRRTQAAKAIRTEKSVTE